MIRSRRPTLRIAMVSANVLPSMGGVETHVHEVCTRLGAAGLDMTVLTADRSGRPSAEEAHPNYHMRRFRAFPSAGDCFVAPGLLRHLTDRPRYDIVHVQGVHTLLPPAALAAARRAGIPAVLTFHTGGHSSGLRRAIRPAQWRLFAPLLRSTVALIAVCEFERRLFADVLGIDPSLIRLIRNGCEPLPIEASAAVPEGNPLLVSVGRFERYKGHHRILGALPEILAAEPHARLVLVGAGPYENQLRLIARELNVEDRVSICCFGPDQRPALGRLLVEADVFCLLSDYEAHPVAVMEAVGAGTNALVADNSGLAELGRAGLVTTIGLTSTPEQIAAAALAVAATPRSAPKVLPTWDTCAEQLARLYHECAV